MMTTTSSFMFVFPSKSVSADFPLGPPSPSGSGRESLEISGTGFLQAVNVC